MRYRKKTLLVILGIIHFLLTVAAMVVGEPTPSNQGSLSATQPLAAEDVVVQAALVTATAPQVGIQQSVDVEPPMPIAEPVVVQVAPPVEANPVENRQATSVAAVAPQPKEKQPSAQTQPAPKPRETEHPEEHKTAATVIAKAEDSETERKIEVPEDKGADKPAAAPTTSHKEIRRADASELKKTHPGLISRIISATKGLIGRAVSWLGTRYIWGGITPKGVDCSGLTRLLYLTEGIDLPHSARLQFKLGQAVVRAALLPGDLVFFNTRGPISHVGMYIGNEKFIHAANPRRGVRVDSLRSNYYNKRFAGARRYKDFG